MTTATTDYAKIQELADNAARFDKLRPVYRRLYNRAKRNGLYHLADKIADLWITKTLTGLSQTSPFYLADKYNTELVAIMDSWWRFKTEGLTWKKYSNSDTPVYGVDPKNRYVVMFHAVAKEHNLDRATYRALDSVYRACCSPTNGERGDVVILYKPGEKKPQTYEVTTYRECYRHHPAPDLFQRRYTLPALSGIKTLLYAATRINNWFGSAWKEREAALD